MAKSKSRGSSASVPAVMPGVAPSLFDRAQPMGPVLALNEPSLVAGKDVAAELKRISRGWDDELEGLLGLRPNMFRLQTESGTFYCSDSKMSISPAIAAFDSGRLGRPQTEYGIVVHEKRDITTFILVDMKRRIMVRERLVNMQDETPTHDWSDIKRKIKSSLAMAESDSAKKGSLVAVYDSALGLLSVS